MKKTRYLVFLFTISFDIIAWFVLLTLWIFFGTNLHWLYVVLQAEFKANSWPMKTWYKKWGGTCFGHAIIYRPKATGERDRLDTDKEKHEHTHTEQEEVAMLASFVYALYLYFVAKTELVHCLIIWTSGFFVFYISSILVAWIRGENPYKGSVLEEHAYLEQERFEQEN